MSDEYCGSCTYWEIENRELKAENDELKTAVRILDAEDKRLKSKINKLHGLKTENDRLRAELKRSELKLRLRIRREKKIKQGMIDALSGSDPRDTELAYVEGYEIGYIAREGE